MLDFSHMLPINALGGYRDMHEGDSLHVQSMLFKKHCIRPTICNKTVIQQEFRHDGRLAKTATHFTVRE